MKFLRLFKKYRELEAKYEVVNKAFDEVCAVCKKLKCELDLTQKALDEARAKLQSPSPAADVANAAPPPRSQKVPHCTTCPYHVRFNNAGKYAHRCNSVGCMISGNDTRTSPRWCPLRGNGEGEQA